MDKKTLCSSDAVYLKLQVPKRVAASDFGNIEMLFEYIGSYYSQNGSTNAIGNAYREILKRTNKKLGVSKLCRSYNIRTSKRQISSIRRCFHGMPDVANSYIFIPYKIYHIFESILEIVSDLEEQNILMPPELRSLCGAIYGVLFYKVQIERYNEEYAMKQNEWLNDNAIAYHLRDDIECIISPFNKEFPSGKIGISNH